MLHDRDRPWGSDKQRQVLACSMVFFMGVAMVVRTDNGDGVPPLILPSDQWHQSWPVTESVAWAPAKPVDDNDARNVEAAAYPRWLQQPDLPNLVRSTEGEKVINYN